MTTYFPPGLFPDHDCHAAPTGPITIARAHEMMQCHNNDGGDFRHCLHYSAGRDFLALEGQLVLGDKSSSALIRGGGDGTT
jgi:hypothetical protein